MLDQSLLEDATSNGSSGTQDGSADLFERLLKTESGFGPSEDGDVRLPTKEIEEKLTRLEEMDCHMSEKRIKDAVSAWVSTLRPALRDRRRLPFCLANFRLRTSRDVLSGRLEISECARLIGKNNDVNASKCHFRHLPFNNQRPTHIAAHRAPLQYFCLRGVRTSLRL